MIRFARPLAVLLALGGFTLAVLLALGGCAGGARQTGIDVAQDVGAGIARNISPAEAAAIKAQCMQAAPALLSATADTAPPAVADVAVYPRAFCEEFLSGKMYLDPAQQNSTWLDNVLKMTATAAQIAGYVLPVILPLL